VTRKKFELRTGISVKDLLLDVSNARIRSGADQSDCIARIAMGKEEQLIALANDIAENGLSTAPILVRPEGIGQFVVWDGNRRVTALKLLHKPSLAPTAALKRRFESIKAKYPGSPSKVDVLASSSREALVKEVVARHGGGQQGAGQLDWSALMRTFFLTAHGQPEPNKRAAHLFLWAEEHGVAIPDDFPITTITRFLSKEVLKRLGFRESAGKVAPVLPTETAISVVRRLAADFDRVNGSQTVEDVRTTEKADIYLSRMLIELGVESAENKAGVEDTSHQTGGDDMAGTRVSPGAKADGGKGGVGTYANGAGGDNANDGGTEDTKPARPRAPNKPTWDRPKLFKGRSAGFIVPPSEVKAYNILAELNKLKTIETPFAVAALFRMLIELSTKRYSEKNALPPKNGTHQKIAAAAVDMFARGLISESTKIQVLRRTTEVDGMLNYNTLNEYMHAWSAHPSLQPIHVLWDELESYVVACWKD